MAKVENPYLVNFLALSLLIKRILSHQYEMLLFKVPDEIHSKCLQVGSSIISLIKTLNEVMIDLLINRIKIRKKQSLFRKVLIKHSMTFV